MRNRSEQQRHADILLAAVVSTDIGWQRFERDADEYLTQREDLAKALADVVEGTALPVKDRVRAGELLGEIGDLRPGVCSLPPAMVRIEGGTFAIGEPQGHAENKDEANDQSHTLVSFELGRYPVTYSQYAMFVNHDGLNIKQPWWNTIMRTRNLSNDIFRLKSKENITYLSNAYPNYPITGISWFEATIFCFGLTSFLADGWVYRLPAELEWEYAARGQARRTFPSGETLIKELQVPDVSDYKLAYPVGCFRETTTPKGAEDMIGNVQEWTSTDWDIDSGQGWEFRWIEGQKILEILI